MTIHTTCNNKISKRAPNRLSYIFRKKKLYRNVFWKSTSTWFQWRITFFLTFTGHWEGIIRSCYEMGTLLTNETNGCHHTKIAGFTTTLCFCDTDYCNRSSVTWAETTAITLAISLLFVLSWNFINHHWCLIQYSIPRWFDWLYYCVMLNISNKCLVCQALHFRNFLSAKIISYVKCIK